MSTLPRALTIVFSFFNSLSILFFSFSFHKLLEVKVIEYLLGTNESLATEQVFDDTAPLDKELLSLLSKEEIISLHLGPHAQGGTNLWALTYIILKTIINTLK